MTETFALSSALAAGVLIGALFFGGLWWTVRMALSSAVPALWFAGSLLLRTALALVGFYYVSGAEWTNLLACLAGFVIARVVVMRLTKSTTEASAHWIKGASHAP